MCRSRLLLHRARLLLIPLRLWRKQQRFLYMKVCTEVQMTRIMPTQPLVTVGIVRPATHRKHFHFHLRTCLKWTSVGCLGHMRKRHPGWWQEIIWEKEAEDGALPKDARATFAGSKVTVAWADKQMIIIRNSKHTSDDWPSSTCQNNTTDFHI